MELTDIYTLSLHDALPIYRIAHVSELPARLNVGLRRCGNSFGLGDGIFAINRQVGKSLGLPARPLHDRSEEHTSELQSHSDIVCRLLLEKKNRKIYLFY